MLFYLYNDFIMYDFNLNILNEDLRKPHHNIKMINELEENLFAKIITNNFKVDEFKTFEIHLINTQVISEIVIGTYLTALIFLYRILLNPKEEYYDYCNKLIGYFKINLSKIFKKLNFTKHDMLIRNIIKPQKKLIIKQSLLTPKIKKNFPPSQPLKATLYPHLKNKYLKYKQKYLELKELLGIN